MNAGTNNASAFSAAATAAIKLNRFVMVGSTSDENARTVTAAADATKPLIGIVTRISPTAINAAYDADAAAGDMVNVQTDGECYLYVNGQSVNIAAGDPLTATTAGVGVKSTTDGDWIGAIALAPATADGVKILVRVINPSRQSAP
jgi:hypothetical protein